MNRIKYRAIFRTTELRALFQNSQYIQFHLILSIIFFKKEKWFKFRDFWTKINDLPQSLNSSAFNLLNRSTQLTNKARKLFIFIEIYIPEKNSMQSTTKTNGFSSSTMYVTRCLLCEISNETERYHTPVATIRCDVGD